MYQLKVDKIMLSGEFTGKCEVGDQIFLDIPLTVESGVITEINDNTMFITYNTLKSNMYGHDITPRTTFSNTSDLTGDEPYMIKDRTIGLRPPTDEEYNALNDYLKKDYGEDLRLWEDYDRSQMNVYDVTEDFKIINSNECLISTFSDGKDIVSFDTYRYAYKHGLIYPYNQNETTDECVENIDGLI